MDLKNNPFNILGANVRDNRKRIVELAEEKSLAIDSHACSKARTDLTNPRNRLVSEVAWLPGVSPGKVQTLNKLVRENHLGVKDIEGISPLALANLIAYTLPKISIELDSDVWVDWIVGLANAVQDIDSEDVFRDINEDRSVAGFPEVKSLEDIENALSERRRYFRDSIRKALDRLPTQKLVEVVTDAVDVATDYGDEHGPLLIDELVDSYEVEVQSFLVKEQESIQNLIEALTTAPEDDPDNVEALINQLEKVVVNWDLVAQPIQVSKKSRGMDDEMSHGIAYDIRQLSVRLFNEYGLLESSKRLNKLSQEVFAELPEVVDTLEEDAEALDEIHENMKQREQKSVQENKEWQREIAYRAEVGMVFKDVLAISHKGVQWKDKTYPLEAIKSVRWGATSHSVNGIPTGTDYSIFFGDNSSFAVNIGLKKRQTYGDFLDKFWSAVCVRLLIEMLQGFKDGKKYKFGNAVFDDYGVTLIKRCFWGEDEKVYGRWEQLQKWSAEGNLYVSLKGDEKAREIMPYLKMDNAHILDAALGMLYKKGCHNMSGLLG